MRGAVPERLQTQREPGNGRRSGDSDVGGQRYDPGKLPDSRAGDALRDPLSLCFPERRLAVPTGVSWTAPRPNEGRRHLPPEAQTGNGRGRQLIMTVSKDFS